MTVTFRTGTAAAAAAAATTNIRTTPTSSTMTTTIILLQQQQLLLLLLLLHLPLSLLLETVCPYSTELPDKREIHIYGPSYSTEGNLLSDYLDIQLKQTTAASVCKQQ